MSDETTTTAEGGQDTGTATETNSGGERTFTQADLDRIVSERLAKEKQRSEQFAAKARHEAERKAAEEQGQWKTLAEQYKTEAETALKQAQAASLAVLRRDVAAKMSVPPVLADRLTGTTADELEADAKQLMASLPKPPLPNANAGSGAGRAGATDGKNMNAYIRAAAGRTQ